jgi:hypothetical protein
LLRQKDIEFVESAGMKQKINRILKKTHGMAIGTGVLISTMVHHLDRQVMMNARLIPYRKAGQYFLGQATPTGQELLWNL